MRRLTPPIIFLFIFLLIAFTCGGNGYTQTKRTIIRPRSKPSPTPKPTDDFFADIPDARPTPPTTPLRPPEWSYLLSQRNVTYTYNTRRITRSPAGVVRVWIKKLPSGKARTEFLSTGFVRKLSSAGRDYTNYEYSLLLEEFDCAKSRWRKINGADYDRAGKVIYFYNFELVGLDKWEDVIPGSIGEGFSAVVCSYKE